MSTGFSHPPWVAVRRLTSIATFRAMCIAGRIRDNRLAVFQYVFDNQEREDLQYAIARYDVHRDFDDQSDSYCPRLAELGARGMIEVVGQKRNPRTREPVDAWRVTGIVPAPWVNPIVGPAEIVLRAAHRLEQLTAAMPPTVQLSADEVRFRDDLRRLAEAMRARERCVLDVEAPRPPRRRRRRS